MLRFTKGSCALDLRGGGRKTKVTGRPGGLVTGGGGICRSCFLRRAFRTNVTLTKARMGSVHVNGYDVGRSFVRVRGKRIVLCNVRVDPCRGKGVFGGSPLQPHGLLVRGGRVRGVINGVTRGKCAVIPIRMCFGKDLMGIRITLTGKGGLCSGHRSVTGGSRQQRTRQSFGIQGLK